jgi:hypothetical protein
MQNDEPQKKAALLGTDSKRRGAAYHEAGLASVAFEVDCKVVAISIEENGNGRTDTECNYCRMPLHRQARA